MAGAGENPARWLASEEDAAFDTPTSAIRCRQVHIDGLPGTDLQKRAASVALTGAHCLGSGSDAPSVGSSAGFGGGSDEDAGESSGGLTVSPSSPDDETDATLYLPAHVVARSANVWPGCNCAGATERSNIVLRFPKNATDRERASLVAVTVLVEFAHFEWKKGDNQEGGPVGMLL